MLLQTGHQCVPERIGHWRAWRTRDEPDPSSYRRLRFGGERRGEKTAWDQRQEGAALHQGSVKNTGLVYGPGSSANASGLREV
jgi:hypothetical protein